MALADGELQRLQEYPWPGNVRELKNILERSLILHAGEALRPSELIVQRAPSPAAAALQPQGAGGPIPTLAQVEEAHICRTLSQLEGNIAKTSRALGCSVSTLKRKIKEYKLR